MDVEVAFHNAVADLESREQLAREFPRLPDRVITAELAQSRRKTFTRLGALNAARRRLRNACTT